MTHILAAAAIVLCYVVICDLVFVFCILPRLKLPSVPVFEVPDMNTPVTEASAGALECIRRHMAAGGQAYRMTPGVGYDKLSERTACTFLLHPDGSGETCAVLVEVNADDDFGDSVEFVCQQIVFAMRPSDQMADLGFAPGRGTLSVILFADGLDSLDYAVLRREVTSLFKKSRGMGSASKKDGAFWIKEARDQ
jgi:hypothetical protein